MIKVVHAAWAGDNKLSLVFSDGMEGVFDFAPLLARETPLTVPLRAEEAFRRFFLELGAVCWPNGLEFSAGALHHQLKEAGALQAHRQAA